MDATEKLVREMTLAVIERFAASKEPLDIDCTLKNVTAGKIRHESLGYFSRKIKKRVFRRLDTKQTDWVSWPMKARRYLGIPEAPPPQAQPVVFRKQEGLPF